MAFPLLYVGTSLFNSLFSVPCGRLADRHGRGLVLLAGYVVLGIVYLVTLLHAASPVAVTLVAIALLGALLRRDRRRVDGHGCRRSSGVALGQWARPAGDRHQS